MQDVYLANDTLVARDVALKTPQPGQKHTRFRTSAVVAARVNHHNVAKTYDYFEFDGQPYLIEELVKGCTLQETGIILDPHLGGRVFLHLARGLSASHGVGVVHRDIKPSNVLVDGPKCGVLKITDFGIATLTEEVFESEATRGDFTRSTSKTIQGAFPYMSPEMMFRKKGDHPAEPSDVWSLGALMFRILTGDYPFGEGFEAAAAVKMGQLSDWPAFMTAKAQFAPLALELRAIVESCLRPKPEDRPTAQALIGMCENLCLYDAVRYVGVVNQTRFGGSQGFITSETGESVFYHTDSVYSLRRPTVGDRVVFSKQAGSPSPRAHPVVLISAAPV